MIVQLRTLILKIITEVTRLPQTKKTKEAMAQAKAQNSESQEDMVEDKARKVYRD